MESRNREVILIEEEPSPENLYNGVVMIEADEPIIIDDDSLTITVNDSTSEKTEAQDPNKNRVVANNSVNFIPTIDTSTENSETLSFDMNNIKQTDEVQTNYQSESLTATISTRSDKIAPLKEVWLNNMETSIPKLQRTNPFNFSTIPWTFKENTKFSPTMNDVNVKSQSESSASVTSPEQNRSTSLMVNSFNHMVDSNKEKNILEIFKFLAPNTQINDESKPSTSEISTYYNKTLLLVGPQENNTNKIKSEFKIPEEKKQIEISKKNFVLLEHILHQPMTISWSSVTYGPYVLQLLSRYSSEYKRIKRLFNKTNYDLKITSIRRLENPFLLSQYLLKKEQIRRKNRRVKERLLFHGTSPDKIDGICRVNFNWRRYGEVTGHKFGQGVCFNPDVSFVGQFGEDVMIMARVLVGRTTEGYEDTVLPPNRYDTTSNTKGTVIVKYEDSEYYPYHVIDYVEDIADLRKKIRNFFGNSSYQ